MRERSSENFLAINQPFPSKLLQMLVVEPVRNRDVHVVPPVIARFVAADQRALGYRSSIPGSMRRRSSDRSMVADRFGPAAVMWRSCSRPQATAFSAFARPQPVISVDTKKKELVGPYKNHGREWQRKGEPERVDVHDFPDPELGKVIPYGVFDMSRTEGWVSVGIDHDTAQFAVQAIGRWWHKMGVKRYPNANALLITADGGGGSNGSRCRLWKVALQSLSARLGVPIHVCHLPPGTSKWNKIEHRMFSHITQNWRGRPLVSHEVIVNLIANTTTRAGLKIRAELDRGKYPTGIKITDAELASLNLKPDSFHGDWNYTVLPIRQNT